MGRMVLVLLLAGCASVRTVESADQARSGVEEFNRALEGATRKMDNQASLALWEEDGISLLPQTAPLVGRPAIAAFFNQVMEQLQGARMLSFELRCSGLQSEGELASEWCTEHQRVELPGGKPPFEGFGKMLLVLRRGADGKWRLVREMWNQGLAPASGS